MRKLLFDLFPVLLFFVAFKLQGIYVATAVAIAATFLQIGYLLVRGRRVEPMLWVSLAIIVVFGGATLAFRDETFIKWKPTILYWLFGIVLAFSAVVMKKNLLQSMLGEQLQLPAAGWSRLNWSWVGFFVAMGVLNLYVAYTFSTDTWVSFKLFGGFGLMILFMLAQVAYLARYVEQK